VEIKLDLDRVDQIEGKAGLLNRGNVSIPKEDFEALKDMAKKHLISGYKVEKLTKDYSSLKNDFDKVYHSRESTNRVSTAIEFSYKIKHVQGNMRIHNKVAPASPK